MQICIAGKNSIAVNALAYLLESFSVDSLMVIPNATDCGLDTWQPSLLKFARENQVRVISLEEAYRIPHLIFLSLEFDRIVRVEKFKSENLFNIHFSKLPKFKGVYTSIMPILCGEMESGVTLHRIDSGIDTGEIIAQRSFSIGINDTARDLYFKYLENAFMLFCENLQSLLQGSFRSQRQDCFSGSYYCRKDVDLQNIAINLKKTSFEIHNQLRAFIFKEYQFPKLNGIAITKSRLSDVFIGRNTFREYGDRFVLSGICGYEIQAYKSSVSVDSAFIDGACEASGKSSACAKTTAVRGRGGL
ncbi:formyltransferase family protein [Helicobacter sp.]|uniref:formyltransferase family protein n=1 Tax=Helicobacter sp. TaxID=218 RepID=UPI0025BD1A09|nr:formyltransferase family protein [Helicobacter sp.]MCI5969165.1 hypothetical protein [Helicobacter sp.]MDY2584402.1 formyltransferase family protein [Helicobacter sp.]